jgi:hypothetical protein
VIDKTTADEFATLVRKLVGQVSHWTPSRWAASSRAARMHDLVQQLADRTADAEGEPRRAVPRLDNDLALPDQLRVVAADAVAAGAADETALALVQAIRTAYFGAERRLR